jgi:c-di-GMP-binding flagellar brake protein YcgR
MKNETDYLVTLPKQVVKHLTDLMAKKCIITAQFGENNVSFLTVLVEIDEKNKEILLDSAPSEQLNQQLLNAVKVLFRTECEGIKVSFRGHKIRKVLKDGSPMLAMPLPDAVFWLQRRDYYRVKIPLFHNGSFCRITLGFENSEGKPYTETYDFKLLDLSIRGFSILVPDNNLDKKFAVNNEAMQGEIFLHDRGNGTVSFNVVYHTDVRISATLIQQRLGCAITDISPSFESKVQLYMQDLERQVKKPA